MGFFLVFNNTMANSGNGDIQRKSISTGFVIINGKYIVPPYVVRREKFDIFINKNKVPLPIRYHSDKNLFDKFGSDPNLSDDIRIKLLDTAMQVYEKGLSEGNAYIFDKDGYTQFGLHQVVYDMPEEIKQVQVNSPRLSSRINELSESLLMSEEFGSTSGIEINDGFVFVDGQYIQAPYIVRRKGLGLFINDVMIETPGHWEPPQAESDITFTNDPEMPSSIHRYSNRYDPDIRKYLYMKTGYFSKKYGKDAAILQMQKTYEQLPCVLKSYIDPIHSELLVVKWYDGSEDRVNLFPPTGRSLGKQTKSDKLERLESQRKNLEERLLEGDYYIFFRSGMKITGNKHRARKILPKLVDVLESNYSVEENNSKLREIGFSVLKGGKITNMKNNFSDSPQLKSRIKKLKEKGKSD